MSKDNNKSGYVEWWNRGNLAPALTKNHKLEQQLEAEKKLKGHYFNPVSNKLEERSDPSPHISSNDKYIHEDVAYNPVDGKFHGQKTDKIFPDMTSAVKQNKRFDEIEFVNRIVEDKKPIKKTWKSKEEFENYIAKRPSPNEYKGTWNEFVKQQKLRKQKGVGSMFKNRSLSETQPVEINYSFENQLNRLEELKAMEADSEKRAAAFRKAMEPVPDADLYRGIGTFDHRYMKGKK